MISALGVPSKKSSPEQQIASMRNYINQFRQDYEDENYNITWEKLAKPLKEKIDGLDKELVAQGENFNYLSANMVSVGYLQANYLSAGQIAANYVATAVLEANYITAAQIAAAYVATSYLEANYITASQIASNYVTTQYLQANYITASSISSTYLQASAVDADYISSKFTSSSHGWFSNMNAYNYGMIVNGARLPFSLIKVQKYGGGEAYCLGTLVVP